MLWKGSVLLIYMATIIVHGTDMPLKNSLARSGVAICLSSPEDKY
jgi:hypothetical protein